MRLLLLQILYGVFVILLCVWIFLATIFQEINPLKWRIK